MDAADASGTPTGVYLYGVVRRRGRDAATLESGSGIAQVGYRDLAALVRPAGFSIPALERADLVAHQRAVERVMRRGTILPAPPGVVFRGRRHVIRFLEDQYPAIEEGLQLLEGHWELRLHVLPAVSRPVAPELIRDAAGAFAELRRGARAAVPFPRDDERLLSAAFLVERAGWVEFVERAEDFGARHPRLSLDVTGPWPPYDFIRMVI